MIWLPPEQYHAQIPKRHIGVAGVFFNPEGNILIVKMSYQNHWGFPGGVIENNESPLEGLKRELREEINLEYHGTTTLRCIDSVQDQYGYSLQLMFDCGTLNQGLINNLKPDNDEIEQTEWVKIDEALSRLGPKTGIRFQSFLTAKEHNNFIYLESDIR